METKSIKISVRLTPTLYKKLIAAKKRKKLNPFIEEVLLKSLST